MLERNKLPVIDDTIKTEDDIIKMIDRLWNKEELNMLERNKLPVIDDTIKTEDDIIKIIMGMM